MRMLVTGAAGFIGRRVCASAPPGMDVVAVVRPGAEVPDALDGANVVEADLSDPGVSLPAPVDAVIHLAQAGTGNETGPAAQELFDVTVAGTTRLLEHARVAGAERFLLASTATVYARSPERLAEDAPLDTSALYSAAKRSAELLLQSYADELSGLGLRIFTPYGPGQRDRLIPRLIERVRKGESVQVEGERGLLLSPIHVDDIAAAIHGALGLRARGPGFDLVNVAADEALGIREIAAQIGAAVGREPVIEELGGDEPGGLTADLGKLRALLPDLRPRPFAEGIRESV